MQNLIAKSKQLVGCRCELIYDNIPYSDTGGRNIFRNVGTYLKSYMVSHNRISQY